MTPPIQLESVSKCYRIFQNPQDRFKQALLDRFENVLGRKSASPLYREHWALRDVGFELQPGEAVGILGRNGAGKSTLLQIIVGTLAPTAGSIKSSGRITALLELGSGFNPEFTGRENVFLNAQILGLSREDALARFDDVASFADIGDFIDQPVKTYSSGMMMRLAFAVQTILDPDVLIVDEALSVGDAKFQDKCFRKLRKLRENGTTILFVSHDINAVTGFCDRAMLLDAGKLIASGIPPDVSKTYLELLYGPSKKSDVEIKSGAREVDVVNLKIGACGQDAALKSITPGGEDRFGNKNVEITGVVIFDEGNKPTSILESGKTYRITQTFLVNVDVGGLSSGFIIRNRLGLDIFGVTNKTMNVLFPNMARGEEYEISFTVDMHLAAGDYFLQIANAGEGGVQYDCWINALHFKVIDTPCLFTTSIVNLNPRIEFSLNA